MKNLKRSTNPGPGETKRIRKILNEEVRLGISPNSESEAEEVDLQRELYPLSHYINNREEMIEQMFSIIKGPKLKKMLPPILKDTPLDELKTDCLIHLLGMSKKRIIAILDGREINSSSDSETHSDSSSASSKKPKVDLKPFVIKQEGCSDISDNSEEVVLVDPDLEFLNVTNSDKRIADTSEEKKKPKRKLKPKDLGKKHKRTKTKTVKQASESDEVEHIKSSAESASETEIQTPKEGKTLLEILELEMRARAIRALLKSNDPQEGEEPKKTGESSIQTLVNSKGKSPKLLKEGTTEKVTPTRNFRKKKRKSDDVIVIAPKVVTIDLTDENEQSGFKRNKDDVREDIAPFSSKNIILDDKAEEVSLNNSAETCSGNDNSSVVTNKEFSKTKEQVIAEVAASGSDGKTSKIDSSHKTAQSENAKSSWAQRWLESKEVKKVVSTSKICGNIRKKIKIAKLAKQQSQNESTKVSSAPQEMEGSVVEYKLLSKSKTTVIDVDGASGIDAPATFSSTNQEPTSSEVDLSETKSADQVQDVSSTRVENYSSLVQDNSSSLPFAEENTSSAKIEYSDPNSIGIATIKFDFQKEMLSSNTHVAADEEVDTSNPKCLNKNYEKNLENVNIYISTETKPNTNVIKNQNPAENKEAEVHNLKSPVKKLQDSSSESVETKTDSNNSEVNSGSIPNSVDNVKNYDSNTLPSEQAYKTNSKISDDSENGCSSKNKNYIESNSDNNQSLETEDQENKPGKSYLLQVSEELKTTSSICSTNRTQEPNEPETLEINITDEDRDIEDVVEEAIEENQSKNFKDSVIILD